MTLTIELSRLIFFQFLFWLWLWRFCLSVCLFVSFHFTSFHFTSVLSFYIPLIRWFSCVWNGIFYFYPHRQLINTMQADDEDMPLHSCFGSLKSAVMGCCYSLCHKENDPQVPILRFNLFYLQQNIAIIILSHRHFEISPTTFKTKFVWLPI